jgi:hypothetical protein
MHGTYATVVIPGTYDLYYADTSTSAMAPFNQSAKLQGGIVVGSIPLTLNVDVPGTAVSGAFTVNGSKVPAASSAVGLSLQSADGGTAMIAQTLGGYTATVIPGTYDVYYEVYSAETGGYLQQSTKVQSGLVVGSSPLTLNVDVPTTTVSGTITVNGAQVASAGGNGRLTLQSAGAIRPFATTAAGTYSTPVVPGTYDLTYAAVTVGTGVPSNASVKLRSGIVIGTSPQTLDIDIPATTVTGTIRVNGAQVDPSLGTAGLHLRNAAGDDAPLGTTAIAGPYAQLVVAGTYDLTYAFVSGGSAGINVPLNQSAKLRSGIVVGSTPLALDVDISASMVSGTLSQNGVPYPGPWGSAVATLILQTASGDQATLGSTFSGTYTRYVIGGTYELTYAIKTRAFGIPFNTLGDLGCYKVP